MHRYILGTAALALLLALGGCGGGDGGGGGPEEVQPTSCGSDCIEPFDPAVPKQTAAPAPVTAPLASAQAVQTVALPPLAATAPAAAPEPGAPLQIGEGRASPATATPAALAALLRWQASSRGTQVAALRFAAQGADGLRLGVMVVNLPSGALLRFYGAGGEAYEVDAQQLQAVAARNAAAGVGGDAARTYWSPQLTGAQTTLEIEIPAGAAADDVQLAVPRLSHITVPPKQQALLTKKSSACEIDVACTPEFIEQGRSVALLQFVEAEGADRGKAFQCTGTLLNDAASSGTPYVLTANHCISNQATASTLNTKWLWRASACGSDDTDPAYRWRTGGAQLLYADHGSDAAFLKLYDALPAGVVYAGSYFGPDAGIGTSVSAVHHPEGDPQKASQGTVRGYASCSGNQCPATDRENGAFLAVNWQRGITEAGSSGAGAFAAIGARRYLVGQLFGGNASCAAPNGKDYFSRFELSYRAALRQWLNP